MRLNNFKKQDRILLESPTILGESWDDFTYEQKSLVLAVEKTSKELIGLFETHVINGMLTEQELDPSMISAIFKTATGSVENRTKTGKAFNIAKLPIKAAKAIDVKVTELGKLLKDTQPVKDIDAKFAKLKSDIATNNPDSKVVAAVEKYSNWAKENPGKSSFAVGVLTALSSIVAGPAGGLAAGFFLNTVDKLTKGEDLSSAVGSSLKTAVYGLLAGMAFKWLSKEMLDAMSTESVKSIAQTKENMGKMGLQQIKDKSFEAFPELKTKLAAMSGSANVGASDGALYRFSNVAMDSSYKRFTVGSLNLNIKGNLLLSQDQYQNFEKFKSVMMATKDPAVFAQAKANLLNVVNSASSDTNTQMLRTAARALQSKLANYSPSQADLNVIQNMESGFLQTINALSKTSDVFAGVIQGVTQHVNDLKAMKGKFITLDKAKAAEQKEEYERENPGEAKKESLIISDTEQLITEGFLDGLIHKTTYKKLEADWSEAGKPTDSNEVAKLLAKYFTPNGVKTFFKDNKVEIEAPAPVIEEPADEETSEEPTTENPKITEIVNMIDASELDRQIVIDYITVN